MNSLACVKRAIGIMELIDLIDSDSDDDYDDHDDDNNINVLGVNNSGDDSGNKKIVESSSLISVNSNSIIKKRKLRDYQNPMEKWSNEKFQQLYHFRKRTVNDIMNMISYGLTKNSNRGSPMPSIFELLITLQFLASGLTQSSSQQSIIGLEISQPTISRLIKRVTSLLSELKLRFIKIPTKQESINLATQFRELSEGCFPLEADIFGCVGATHVAIRTPNKSVADDYFNENGVYSFRIMLVCGPDMKFFEIISRWPGATHQNNIFNISETYQRFEYKHLDGILLADQYFEMRDFVFTPVMHPVKLKDVQFNQAHKKTYTIPNAVKLWKRRFRCLDSVLLNKEDTVQSIITACAVLHNIAIERKEPLPAKIINNNQNPVDQIPTTSNDKLKFNMNFNQDPKGSVDRDNFIHKYF